MQIQYIFIIFAIMIVASALFVLWSKNVVHSAFMLFFTFIGVAGIFVFANADYLAVAQIMIYVGGILILLVFGILLTNKPNKDKIGVTNTVETTNYNRLLGGGVAILLFSGLFFVVPRIPFTRLEAHNFEQFEPLKSTVKNIGIYLITENSLPFEAIALLLFGALIGAGYIAKLTLNEETFQGKKIKK
jgi:NADH:ubiquinone oxidoreductase subunit 6 (subunit J)